jgi:hypothetical protein
MLIRRSFAKPREWHAWSGELEDLRRIGRIIEELYSEHPGSQENPLSINNLPTSVTNIHAGGDAHLHITVPADEDIEFYPFLGMILVDDERVSGDVDEVMAELDRRSTRKITFIGALAPRDRITLFFDRENKPAIVLSIESPHSGWARQALSRLSVEIEKGVPVWAYLRANTFKSVMTKLAASLMLSAALAVALIEDANPGDRLGATAFLAFFISFAVMSERLLGWIFPGVEILGEGVQSTGSRRIALLLALLASIPVGVLVNRIS